MIINFLDAALRAKSEGCLVKLKIMLPRVVLGSEVSALLPGLQSAVGKLFNERGVSIAHEFGTNEYKILIIFMRRNPFAFRSNDTAAESMFTSGRHCRCLWNLLRNI